MERKKDRRRYPKEFKVEAVRQSEQAGVTVKEVARELGVSDRLLYKWRREFLKPLKKPDSVDEASLQSEVRRLRRENERLLEERAILKKAIRYFAEEE